MYRGDTSGFAEQLNQSFKASRSMDRAADANRSISVLRSQLLKLEIIQHAMWELMTEQGISQDQLNAKIDAVISGGYKFSYVDDVAICPRCGKNVREGEQTPMVGRCMFCGTNVTFYPYSSDNATPSAPDEQNIGDDPLADLDNGF
ncbi:MAG: hypothetical protein J6X33_01565 [Clostridiales bacterium]|nr:hypothetical protein [Clostridiales bacterium]